MAGGVAQPSAARSITFVNAGLLLLIAAALILKLRLVPLLNVNWDEFFFLSLVHQYLRGELTAQLQTFHVHLFWWLPLLSDDEISQIIAARLVMYVLGLGSCAFTYLIARRFLNQVGALFAVLTYLSVSNIIEHGTSFRADPIGAFLFLAAVYLLLRQPNERRAAIVAGLLMALSTMVTIKAAIHLAAIASMFLALLATADRRREIWARVAIFGLAFAIGLSLLYGLHRMTLAGGQSMDAGQFASATADKMFRAHGFFPRWRELGSTVVLNPVVWGLMVAGLAILAFDAIHGRDGALRRLLVFGAFLVPLLSVLVYRNAFPYFYVFVLSPAVVLSGIVADRLARLGQAARRSLALSMVAALAGLSFLSLARHYRTHAASATVVQRQIVGVVHRMFPEPVPYIDGSFMIASFPQAGFFMTTWGIEAYRNAGRPVLAEAIAGRSPVFVLTDNESLSDAMVGTHDVKLEYSLLEADRTALTQNYIPHWGAIYVAGKTLQFLTNAPRQFLILIPGPYTVEAAGGVVIDDRHYVRGDAVRLERGVHVIAPQTVPTTITLRWGKHLFRPTDPPSSQPVFTYFK